MKATITSPQVTKLLDHLYADSEKNDPAVHQAARESGASHANEPDFYKAVNKAYMAIGRDLGHLLYSLARTAKAKTIVEFGTSFGVSTIYLAAAIRDNGAGKVITTEFDAGKAEQARKNLAAAGLEDCVDFRVGDALESLATPPRDIDLILLDGAKGLYLPVLKLLEPQLRSGGIVASDNTDHDGLESFLAHLRDPAKYVSAAISTPGKRSGHEITIRV